MPFSLRSSAHLYVCYANAVRPAGGCLNLSVQAQGLRAPEPRDYIVAASNFRLWESLPLFYFSNRRKGERLLAIYHLSIKIVSRGKGKSAVAAAAYQAGAVIRNEYDGLTHDYSKKTGVVHTEILLPDNAPREYTDRATFWNAVEKCERYKTAQLAREIEIALPAELSREQNISLAQRYVKENFVSAGMCADVCIHDTGAGNPHAHIMLTMRPIERDGLWGQKSRTVDGKKIPTVDWNEQTKAEDWRKAWAAYCNTALRIHGHDERIDHRSFERQGIDQVPTIHLGVAASQMERKGIRTERGDINREIEVANSLLRQLKARINKLTDWTKEEAENPTPPTLADVISNILQQRQAEQPGRYGSAYNLKAAANMLNFLTENNIQDKAGLDEKFKSMIGRQLDIGDKLKPIERRLKTLDEHIKQAEMYFEHRDVYNQYTQQKPKKQEAFYESHRREITLFECAKSYLTAHMNDKTTIPTKSWKAEREKLVADKQSLTCDYYALKNEVSEAEKIRRGVYDIMRGERRREQPRMARDMER